MAEAFTAKQMIYMAAKLGEAIGRCENKELAKQASVALDGLFSHIEALEDLLTWIDGEFECLGTEGWRHRLGID